MKIVAIVLSAGNGSRMHSSVPKQYMDLEGQQVLTYSLQAFQKSQVDEIVLVTGTAYLDYCKKEFAERLKLDKIKKIIEGGEERYLSVYSGICAVKDADYILIHDGARPFINRKIIDDCIRNVKKYGACVAGMPVKDTIKEIDKEQFAVQTPQRSRLWQVQTPQAFESKLIKEAYQILFEKQENGEKLPEITDDAMVVEYTKNRRVKLFAGSYENIKITTPEDLEIASIFAKKRNLKK